MFTAHISLDGGTLAIAAAAAFGAGIINAIAGGGTLLTFPSLIAAGIPALVANATSTVALVPGAMSSFFGYRDELAGARKWAVALFVPSLLGGGTGAWLLLHTPAATFDLVVPWLVFGATVLFVLQPRLVGWIRTHEHDSVDDDALTRRGPTPVLLAWQYLIGIYGGYFGAGVGILMLAALGFMGFTNIHRMNGLKNWGGFWMNTVAAVSFAASGIVDWPVAILMAGCATLGGYVGSRGAQRLPKHWVRRVVAFVGFSSAGWLFLR
ncbi:MAG: sulfite exporter TauE/SafE family protein [Gemmatimonadaceae bacterium]